MKVSREQAAENRERIVQVAAKLFRERGFDGIGVADLMKAAGLNSRRFLRPFRVKGGSGSGGQRPRAGRVSAILVGGNREGA